MIDLLCRSHANDCVCINFLYSPLQASRAASTAAATRAYVQLSSACVETNVTYDYPPGAVRLLNCVRGRRASQLYEEDAWEDYEQRG